MDEPLFQGKPLRHWHTRLRDVMLAGGGAMLIDTALSKVNLTDVFDRKRVSRSFRATLLEGGENFDLSEKGLWAEARITKKTPVGITRSKAVAPFVPTTAITNALSAKVERLDGRLPVKAKEATLALTGSIAASAGRSLSEARQRVIVEDVERLVDETVRLQTKVEEHEDYREDMRRKDAMLDKLISTVTQQADGTSLRK